MLELLYKKAEEVVFSSPLISQHLQLYFRCRRFSGMQLPCEGGILDQEEITMQLLEIIHEIVVEYEREQQEDAVNRMKQETRVASAKQQFGKRGLSR